MEPQVYDQLMSLKTKLEEVKSGTKIDNREAQDLLTDGIATLRTLLAMYTAAKGGGRTSFLDRFKTQ